ncbi:hypothetical protein DP63_4438 [Burkholderia pseudomallei MSHR5855]|nr:hypothetical protein DP63_4438 [Burkholderia pseudomallei MSHR5855]AIP42948.1 hypothetical protein DP65_4879 [Burkholderia pseudomallei MSHR5848]
MRALRNACVAPVCGVSAILRAKAERRISPPPAPRIGGATSVRGAALYRDSNLDRLRTESGERFDFARAQCIIKSRRPVAERGFHDCRASACRANERSGRGGGAPSRRGAMRGAGVVQGAAGGRIAEEKYPVLLAETRGKLETTSMPRPYGAEFTLHENDVSGNRINSISRPRPLHGSLVRYPTSTLRRRVRDALRAAGLI